MNLEVNATVRLDKATHDKLHVVCKVHHKSAQSVIRCAIKRLFADLDRDSKIADEIEWLQAGRKPKGEL